MLSLKASLFLYAVLPAVLGVEDDRIAEMHWFPHMRPKSQLM